MDTTSIPPPSRQPRTAHLLLILILTLTLTTHSHTSATDPIHTLVCEKDAHTLRCPSSYTIITLNAAYGRTAPLPLCMRPAHPTADTAPSGTLDTQCVAPPGLVLGRVAALCNGRRECEVHARNDVFGDPCPGTNKYLNVTYLCGAQQISEPHPDAVFVAAAACRGDDLLLKCPDSLVVDLLKVRYGRSHSTQEICPLPSHPSQEHSTPHDTTSCEADADAHAVVAAACQGVVECVVTQVGNDVFGTNACADDAVTAAQVQYQCVPPENAVPYRNTTAEETLCEGKSNTISCDPGKTVRITHATYGRTSQVPDCGYTGSVINSTTCGAPDNALQTLQKQCEGRKLCELDTTAQLNDIVDGTQSCIGIKKYLEYSYRCVEATEMAPPTEVPLLPPVEEPSDMPGFQLFDDEPMATTYAPLFDL